MINFGGIFNIDAAGGRGWQVYVGKAQTLYFHLKMTLLLLNFAERRYLLLKIGAATSDNRGRKSISNLQRKYFTKNLNGKA